MKNKWDKGRGALSVGQRKSIGLQAMFNRGTRTAPTPPAQERAGAEIPGPGVELPELPEVSAGSDQSVGSGATVILTGSITGGADITISDAVYTWEIIQGSGVTLTNSDSLVASFTAVTVAAATTLIFRLTAVDGDGGTYSVADSVNIVVVPPPNTAPTANAGTDQSVSSGAAVTLNGTGSTDPENNPLTYDWSQTAGNTVSLSSKLVAQPTFTTSYGAAQVVLTFRLIVNDGQLSSSQDSVNVTVGPLPAPTANAGPNQIVPSNTLVTLNGSGSSDPNGLSLTYAWSQVSGSAVVLSDASNVGPTFTSYSASVTADVVMGLAVFNGFVSSTSDTVVLTVNPPPAAGNNPPVSNAGPDQSVSSGAAVTLTGAGSSDPDGNPLTYAWSQAAGTTVSLNSSIVQQPTFTAPTLSAGASNSTLQFRLTVSDGLTSGAADTVNVVVVAPPSTAAITYGVFKNHNGQTTLNQIATYQSWLGKTIKTAVYYTGTATWADVEGPSWLLNGNCKLWLNGGSNRQVSLAIAMPSTGVTLASIAAGTHDAHYRTLADNLATYGLLGIELRVFIEFDGTWFAWKAYPGSGLESTFVNAYKKIHDVMEARQPSNTWTWVWNPCDHRFTNRTYLESVYPGNSYVDKIGIDCYDQTGQGINSVYYPSGVTTAQRNTVWAWRLARLNIFKDMAAEKGKPIQFPEWGVIKRNDQYANTSGLDNPIFIQGMYDFIFNAANNVSDQYYFDVDVGATNIQHKLSPTTIFPNASQKFLDTFGS